MKQIWKKICSIALLAVVLLGYTVCPNAAAVNESDDGMQAGLIGTAESLTQAIVELSQDEIDTYKASGDAFTVSAMEAWESSRDELGEFKALGKSVAEETADGYSVTISVEFSNYNAEMVYLYDETGVPTSFSINTQYPMSVLMKRAGMNTLMGLGIVFAMLLFLTAVISLFRFLGRIEEKSQPEAEVIPEPPVPVQMQPQPAVEETDNKELIAVIAAAIAAYEGTSADRFVVRSIKKANRRRNRW